MQSSVTNLTNPQGGNPQAEPPKFSRRIGSTNYIVSVHFSQTSKETIEDKLIRLLKSEVRNSA